MMNVLIVGNGAREHAIGWKISSGALSPHILTAPGNAGTAQLGDNCDVSAEDVDGLVRLALERSVDLTIVGPEVPLAMGIVDRFEAEGLRIFGPTRAAARIESSKAFAKKVMASANVPTAEAMAFSDIESAVTHIYASEPPFVVKADGLAAGKGVIMASTRNEASEALDSILVDREFGDAGSAALVEEWLTGVEASVFAFVDGRHVSEMTAACDYKRAYDGDLGPNTGGMGSYSPPPFWNREMEDRIRADIMEPVATRMAEMGCPYRGILYAGLMLTDEGPKVLEFNCRMGDPEAQVVLPRLKTDLLELALSVSEGDLASQTVEWSDDPWVGVALASEGYPGDYDTGFEICSLPDDSDGRVIFHAGTTLSSVMKSKRNAKILTSGGRVLTAAARGDTLSDARRAAYEIAGSVKFDNAFFRKDIAANV